MAITFRNSAREAQHTVIDLGSFGVRAVALRCDITDEKSVRSAIKETVKELGGIDILVNNAANYETAEFGEITLQQWDAIFASNTRGPFLVSREALKHLRERRGKIINMGSLGGLRPWASHAHYCSSKAAVHMLTKVMAKALAPEIAVNCIAPGMIDLGEKAAASFMKKMARQTPMRRNGKGEEIAAAALFFATGPTLHYRADPGGGWWIGPVTWSNVGRALLSRHKPRGDSRPRLSGGAKLRYFSSTAKTVELRSTGQPRAAVPTWFEVRKQCHPQPDPTQLSGLEVCDMVTGS